MIKYDPLESITAALALPFLREAGKGPMNADERRELTRVIRRQEALLGVPEFARTPYVDRAATAEELEAENR